MRHTRVVDLTHTLHPDFPVWPGDAPFRMSEAASIAHGGFCIQQLQYWEHVGTHLDAPSHRVPNGTTTDCIPPADLVAPLIVLDISGRAARDPATVVTTVDVDEFEAVHGRIPERAFVAMYSGWEPERGGQAPGFGGDAVTMLVADRGIVGLGVDTLSLDVADSTDYPAHTVLLGSGRYGVEALANLAEVPATGALVVVGAPKHRGGTGGPCRVLALV